ncbi:MAG: MFS transporter, partial [Spirochaetales bacterium]|nr:MFS transporter [Spirochaetales bacterium]
SRPKLLVLALCVTCFSFTYSQALFALPLYVTRLYGQQGAVLYGSMMSVNAIVVVLCNAPIVFLLRRRNPLKNIAAAGLLYAVGFACMGLARLPVWFYILTVVYTLGEITDATNTHYYIANNTPISHRARFNAVLPVITGFGHAVAPIIGGSISHAYGLEKLWLIIGITALVGSLGVYAIFFKEKHKLVH